MTPTQIDLVQQSFADVKPIAATAAELFYHRLFTLDPDLRRLFKGDMARQGQMLMGMIGATVTGLKNLEKLAEQETLRGSTIGTGEISNLGGGGGSK